MTQPRANSRWPLSPAVVLGSLSTARLLEVAAHFRIPLGGSPSWDQVCGLVLVEPGAHAVALLHLLTRRELGDVCRHLDVHDEGPTQDVLARLLPLCEPGRDRSG